MAAAGATLAVPSASSVEGSPTVGSPSVGGSAPLAKPRFDTDIERVLTASVVEEEIHVDHAAGSLKDARISSMRKASVVFQPKQPHASSRRTTIENIRRASSTSGMWQSRRKSSLAGLARVGSVNGSFRRKSIAPTEAPTETAMLMSKYLAKRSVEAKWREKAAGVVKEHADLTLQVGALQRELFEARRRVDSERDMLLVEQVTTLDKELAHLAREIREQLSQDNATVNTIGRLKKVIPPQQYPRSGSSVHSLQNSPRLDGGGSVARVSVVDTAGVRSGSEVCGSSPSPPDSPSGFRLQPRHFSSSSGAGGGAAGDEEAAALQRERIERVGSTLVSPKDAVLLEPFCLKCMRAVNATSKNVALPTRTPAKITSETLLLKLVLLARKQAEAAESTQLAQQQRITQCDQHIAQLHALIHKLQVELRRMADGKGPSPTTGVTMSDLSDVAANLSFLKYSAAGLKSSILATQQFMNDCVQRAGRAVQTLGRLNSGYDGAMATLRDAGARLTAELHKLREGHTKGEDLDPVPDAPDRSDVKAWQMGHRTHLNKLLQWLEEYSRFDTQHQRDEAAAAARAVAAAAAAQKEESSRKPSFPRPRRLASRAGPKPATAEAEANVTVEELGYQALKAAAVGSMSMKVSRSPSVCMLSVSIPELEPMERVDTSDHAAQVDGVPQRPGGGHGRGSSVSADDDSGSGVFDAAPRTTRDVGTQSYIELTNVGTLATPDTRDVGCGGVVRCTAGVQADVIPVMDEATTTTTSFFLKPSKAVAAAMAASVLNGTGAPGPAATGAGGSRGGSTTRPRQHQSRTPETQLEREAQLRVEEAEAAAASKAYSYKYVCEVEDDDDEPGDARTEAEAWEAYRRGLAAMRHHLQRADDLRERVATLQKAAEAYGSIPPSRHREPTPPPADPPVALGVLPSFAAARGPRWGAADESDDHTQWSRMERVAAPPIAGLGFSLGSLSTRGSTPLHPQLHHHVLNRGASPERRTRAVHAADRDRPSLALDATGGSSGSVGNGTAGGVLDVSQVPLLPQQPPAARDAASRRGARGRPGGRKDAKARSRTQEPNGFLKGFSA